MPFWRRSVSPIEDSKSLLHVPEAGNYRRPSMGLSVISSGMDAAAMGAATAGAVAAAPALAADVAAVVGAAVVMTALASAVVFFSHFLRLSMCM
mmetsp:Transcript_53381/g.103280  ORF Transcript_53381/g.103280 Transcript_53381/m.103280 type:complete len:94 (-) Transcript_53381:547-828(-)